MQHANLSGSYMERCSLFFTRLGGGNLQGAQLSKANLAHADFQDADLRDTILVGANLSEARVGGARMEGTHLGSVQNWEEIIYIGGAVISSVRNPPVGFLEWAKNHGAIVDGEVMSEE
ncbi:MAG: pentapeptide repeat-containing protein [Planctomycetota bacterium]|nr:pentapeptide repeat-containing protein [Planctomycetota bacterium]